MHSEGYFDRKRARFTCITVIDLEKVSFGVSWS